MRLSSDMAIPKMPAVTATEAAARPPDPPGRGWFQLLLFGPVALFLVLMLAFVMGLERDPKLVPSPLIGKPVPDFSLPPVKGRSLGLSSDDLQGEVSLVNVFASWCVACSEEHPVLMRLKAQSTVPIHGLNYKDKPDDAARWLDGMGDPYTGRGRISTGGSRSTRGSTVCPKPSSSTRAGRIAFKQVGPITREILEETILPVIAGLRADLPAGSGGDR
jgi:cytochrome c biogenesis protein CcmG/thiol:disulfide interchange protein DsbE